jgi:CRISPR-associated protein Csx17
MNQMTSNAPSSDTTSSPWRLSGCAPAPLARYLKALGIFRLVTQQADPEARGHWRSDDFFLDTSLSRRELLDFFVEDYRPSPLIVPWSGSNYFKADSELAAGALDQAWPKTSSKKYPKSAGAIEAVVATEDQRLADLRSAVRTAFEVMDELGLDQKSDLDRSEAKAMFIQALRNRLDETGVDWIDAASVLTSEKARFNHLVGSGGGSDGNSNFGINFLQAVWLVLPEFDRQRSKFSKADGNKRGYPVPFDARESLAASLFEPLRNEAGISDLSPSLFDSANRKSHNGISDGFTRSAAYNPWDFIFLLEGTVAFSGSLQRKYGTQTSTAAFPYLVDASPAGDGSFASNEDEFDEIWLPIWSRNASYPELQRIFSNARIAVGREAATSGVEVLEAISRHGVDRGIDGFQRIGLVKGRIGGDNYYASFDGDYHPVRRVPEVDLFEDFRPWLARTRRKSHRDDAPPRLGSALMRLEEAMFRAAAAPGKPQMRRVLLRLADCQKLLCRSLVRARDEARISPVPQLSSPWLQAIQASTPEFRLAAALASTYGPFVADDAEYKVGIRRHVEPLYTTRNGDIHWLSETGRDVAWHGGDPVDALNAVFGRRLLHNRHSSEPLGARTGDMQNGSRDGWKDRGRVPAALTDIAAFVQGRLNLEHFADLFCGLLLVDWTDLGSVPEFSYGIDGSEHPGALYALLKLCFTPQNGSDSQRAGDSRRDVMPVVPQIHRLAASGDATRATELAARRLRGSGSSPLVDRVASRGSTARRAAAALAFPLWDATDVLEDIVLADDREES